MSELGINRLLALSKEAKKNNNFSLERNYLEQALSLAPTNIKLINALIRNLRKERNTIELKKWLYTLYKLKPNGIILAELIKLERQDNNFEIVRELLKEDARINARSKKIKKRYKKACRTSPTRCEKKPSKDITDLITKVRNIIYSDEDYEEKKNHLADTLVELNEETTLCILSEFFANESLNTIAIKEIKKYKRTIPEEEKEKIKLINKLLNLVLSKKAKKYNWDDFWRNNINVICSENEDKKILLKQ